MSTYVDTHAHLSMLEHAPLEDILAHAKAQSISHIVTVSTEEGNWEPNRKLAEAHAHIYYSLGLHPHQAIRWPECAPHIHAYFKDGTVPKKCVAIGEMGLDYHYDYSPREMQMDVLESQLTLAKSVGLPVIIHCRDAFQDLYGSLGKIDISARTGVMHCFTGNKEQAQQALDLGLKISFSGILTFKNATALREAAEYVPLEHIFLETDCPFLAPIPYRGKPNEPSYLPHTALVLAQIKGLPIEEIAQQTSQNAIEFFQLGA